MAVFVSNKVPTTLVGDPGRFRQIVMNLVGNSIKVSLCIRIFGLFYFMYIMLMFVYCILSTDYLQFTEKGHIFVTVHLVEEVIEMEVEREVSCSLSGLPVVDRRQSWKEFKIFNQEASSLLPSEQVNLMVSVEDTGQGIPPNDHSRVFNPFMQVRPSITRTHGGTGIGLSISKCLVHLMKGEIGLASLPQIGSTFSFTAVFSNGCSNDTISPQSEFHGMRALVVDPNPVRANVSKYHIQRLGIHVDVVPDVTLPPTNTPMPINMVFLEDEIWNKKLGTLVLLSNNLEKDGGVTPRFLLLSNSTSSTLSGLSANGVLTSFVVMKPLRASMLAASLQRVMGVRSCYRNGELHTLSLSTLLRGRKILVVDDNPVNLRVAAGALKKYGADVVHAERGIDAISFLTPPHSFDACFMDIQMPEMDG